ncbi:MAG: DUF2197 domain-containing protein [Clostridia bacterium]|nr:DUF2197 domain-containing protein [Clostridia bacterium]
MEKCAVCQKTLTRDEIGITKKLINRGAESFLCKECLARRFKIEVKDVDRLIENFRRDGCSLFL